MCALSRLARPLVIAGCIASASGLQAQRAVLDGVGTERERMRAAAALAAVATDARRECTGLLCAAATLRLHGNSDFPVSVEPGPAWTGRGLTTVLAVDGQFAWRGVTVRLAPELWQTENRATRLIVAATPMPNPFADPMRPTDIDLPQRLGDGQAARLDPGQSGLDVRALGLRMALTSAAARVGPGLSHTILLAPDAPGFPRLEIGTSTPWRLPVGDVQVTLAAGRVGQTRWAPERRTGARSVSYFDAQWRPLRNDLLRLGTARLYHRDWQGARLADLLEPFGSLFFDAQTFAGGEADNQLLSVYAAGQVPALHLELFAEFGLNDRQPDLRGAVVELEHNSAWIFGFRRAVARAGHVLWQVEGTAASARIPPIQNFRPQFTFYEHFPIRQGHTNRGHLLGTRLLERTGGAELRVDRYASSGRVGLVLGTRDLPQVRALTVPETALRREWSLLAEVWHTDARGLEWFARVGGIADLNRYADGEDAYSAVLGTGVAWRWDR